MLSRTTLALNAISMKAFKARVSKVNISSLFGLYLGERVSIILAILPTNIWVQQIVDQIRVEILSVGKIEKALGNQVLRLGFRIRQRSIFRKPQR